MEVLSDVASHSSDEGLPITWPFRTAGTLVMVALAWFCFGFAFEDAAILSEENSGAEAFPDLPGWLAHGPADQHLNIFWLLLLAAVVLVVIGAIWNRSRSAGGH